MSWKPTFPFWGMQWWKLLMVYKQGLQSDIQYEEIYTGFEQSGVYAEVDCMSRKVSHMTCAMMLKLKWYFGFFSDGIKSVFVLKFLVFQT